MNNTAPIAQAGFVTNLIGPYVKKKTSKVGWICCPFHEEQEPSLKINLDTVDGFPPGTFYCFGCGESGSWNKLAQKLGLPELTASTIYESALPILEQKMLSWVKKPEQKEQQDEAKHQSQWYLVDKPWRTLSAEFLNGWGSRLGMWFCPQDRQHYKRLFLFCYEADGSVLGHIAARLDPADPGPKYANASGTWAQYAFYPNLLSLGHRRIVLVEGPYDALRLLSFGIPAMAILGVENWKDCKIQRLLQSFPELVIVCGDGDRGGYSMNAKVFETISSYVTTRIFQIPLMPNDPLDPGNMPETMVQKLKWFVENL